MSDTFVDRVMEAGNGVILDAYMKCQSVFEQHEHALVSVSGGADSDCMLDLVEHVRRVQPIKVTYIFFNTGTEYVATKRHLDYLEQRYGIEILRYKAEKSIPLSVREYGQPFISKYVSEQMYRLQRWGFMWEDEPYEVLVERYQNCSSALKWWTNGWTNIEGVPGYFDIGRNKCLKEFIVENPPQFRISAKCCTYAKKRVGLAASKELGADVQLVGVRKAEGGVRSARNVCYFKKDRGPDLYHPIYWFTRHDKEDYCRLFDVRHSDCYTTWGFARTGCVGCPFNRNVQQELEVAGAYEPRMVNAVKRVFHDSYEYTMAYRRFRDAHSTGQMTFDLRHARG